MMCWLCQLISRWGVGISTSDLTQWSDLITGIVFDLVSVPKILLYCTKYRRPMTLSGNARGIKLGHHHGHQNGQHVWCFFCLFFLHATPLSAGMIQSKYLPNGGVQWLLVKPWTPSIGRCMQHCTGASSWPSKWVAMVVYCFALLILTSIITVDNRVVILI